jgi:hypothetical protein
MTKDHTFNDAQGCGMRDALIAAREYIEPDTDVPWADRLLAQIDAALAAQPPAAPVENKKGDQVHWLKVNDEPFEYAIQQGSHGDEFVKLLNGECLRRPVSPFSAGSVADGLLRERIAINLWHKFAPEHHMEWEEETHQAEYLLAADDVLFLTRNEPQAVQVTDADVERAWAAIVGSDVAGMCFQASVVRGDIRTALESLALSRPEHRGPTPSAPVASTPSQRLPE